MNNAELLKCIDRLADLLFPCRCRECVIDRSMRMLADMDAHYAKKGPVIQ